MNSISLRSRRLLPLAIALALGVPAADAATITVTTAGDAGTASTCTLRQALESANNDSAGTSNCTAGSGDDTVAFASNLRASTITLAGIPLHDLLQRDRHRHARRRSMRTASRRS